MNRFLHFRTIVLMILIFANIGCDQISKKMVRAQMNYDEQIFLIPDHLLLTKVENTGAFLSIGSTLSPALKKLFLLGLPILGLSFMLLILIGNKKLERDMAISLAFIIGGGIGNLIDRVLYGSVTDFLHMDFGIFRTGIFNLADVSITIGILYYVFVTFLQRFSRNSKATV